MLMLMGERWTKDKDDLGTSRSPSVMGPYTADPWLGALTLEAVGELCNHFARLESFPELKWNRDAGKEGVPRLASSCEGVFTWSHCLRAPG